MNKEDPIPQHEQESSSIEAQLDNKTALSLKFVVNIGGYIKREIEKDRERERLEEAELVREMLNHVLIGAHAAVQMTSVKSKESRNPNFNLSTIK